MSHPAHEFLLTNLSFNLTQLRDLEYICEHCELATGGSFPQFASPQWNERAKQYRKLFLTKISELEAQFGDEPLRGHVSADHKKHGVKPL